MVWLPCSQPSVRRGSLGCRGFTEVGIIVVLGRKHPKLNSGEELKFRPPAGGGFRGQDIPRKICEAVNIEQSENPSGDRVLAERPVGARNMLHLIEPRRSYPPETIAVMTAAFDRTLQSLPKPDSDDVRRTVASIILRHVDQGVRDPVRLSALACGELEVIIPE